MISEQLFRSTLVAALAALTAPASAIGAAEPEPEVLGDIMTDLDLWLDGHCGYASPECAAPEILFVDSGARIEIGKTTCLVTPDIRGIYDKDRRRILLVSPWDPSDPFDQSVLLHELVHHRQTTHFWQCEAQAEWPAYELQEAWLLEHGIDPDFDWMRIYLRSGCREASPHPE